ncbi:MAG: [FeFe] hydrogenase, group A [Anaerovoracaceae bacterium]
MNTGNNQRTMIINGMPVPIEGEKNILDVIRKAGFEMPTLCYYSDLSTYGACRMCIVEDKKGTIMASCSTPPRAGMEIKTNTPRLQEYRKMILELMLADHNRDCTTCEKRANCQLQELAARFGVDKVRFETYSMDETIDTSSPAIIRHPDKCILCGDCVRMCDEIQNVGAIDFVNRGSKMNVEAAFNMPLAESNCVNCGQCAAVCPTAAITIKSNVREVWEMLNDDNIIVQAQIAPAVRVALGDEFDMPKGTNVMGNIVAAMRKMGFDEVYDTSTGADLTVMEESAELLERLKTGENLPLLTSCCPAWFKYVETFHPDLKDNVSSCKSPMEMFGAVLKERAAQEGKNAGPKTKQTKVIAVMPCTAKKYEVRREEFNYDDKPAVDVSITTQELAAMIREAGLRFYELLPEAVDMPYGIASGAGVIFGVTGGVTEAVIRAVAGTDRTAVEQIAFTGVRGFDGVKEVQIPYGDRELSIAIVSGLRNAENLLNAVKRGEIKYDFIEVMACRGGCIAGAGQPFDPKNAAKEERATGMYDTDRMSNVRVSQNNPVTEGLYNGLLKGRNAHRLLHYK